MRESGSKQGRVTEHADLKEARSSVEAEGEEA
jgi:hypothetical protein